MGFARGAALPSALLFGLLSAVPASFAQEAARVREAFNSTSPLTSPDGAFRVGAASEPFKTDRFPVLSLCRSLHQRLAYVTRAATQDGGVIFILLGAPERGGGGITVTRPNPWISHFIEVADLGTVDAGEFEAVVAHCLLNNWLAVARRAAGKPASEEIPPWFARGLAALADSRRREASLGEVEALMMAGRVGAVSELLGDGGPPGTATMLVAWLMETNRNGYAQLHAALADGAAWSGELLLEKWLGMAPPAAQESWDLWLQHCRAMVVFDPGTAEPDPATPRIWERLKQLLYVYPVDTAMPGEDAQRGKTFSELAAMPPSPWRRRAAESRMMELQKSAIGRDAVYRGVIEAYCDFLGALLKNERPEKLRALLSIAEARYLAAYVESQGLNKEQP